ncbi:hypothetical protein TNCV_659181 [Trichonephila clavipes]|nr:hypothetical protein TNCV_659181 [Trichonephila clavipes]
MQSKERNRLDAGCKLQSLQDSCFKTRDFFLRTKQQDLEQAEELLSAYVVMCLMPGSDPVQMSMLCGDFGRPSW